MTNRTGTVFAVISIIVFVLGMANGGEDYIYDGVARERLAEWIAGPGLVLAKKLAKDDEKTLTTKLAAASRGRIDKRVAGTQEQTVEGRFSYLFSSNEVKQETVAKLKEQLADAKRRLEKPEPEFPELFCHKLAVGRIGRLRRVRSVGDDAEASSVYEVTQVIDENNLLAQMDDRHLKDWVTVWLTMPTRGMVDGKTYSTGDQIFEVVGTKKYDTAIGGSRTVFQLVLRSKYDLLNAK